MSTLYDAFKLFENNDATIEDFKAFEKFYKTSNESIVEIKSITPNCSLYQELAFLYVQYGFNSNLKHELSLALSHYLKIYQNQDTCLLSELYQIFKDPVNLNTLEIVFSIIEKNCNSNKIFNRELVLLNRIANEFLQGRYVWLLHDGKPVTQEYGQKISDFLDFLKFNLKQSSVTPNPTTLSTQETTAMNKITTAATTAITAQVAIHQGAAIQASLQEIGKTVIDTTKEMIKPHIPPMVGLFIDHPLADLVIASGVSVILTAVKPTDKKALAISKAVLVVGYSKAIGTLQIPMFVSKLISSVPDHLTDTVSENN